MSTQTVQGKITDSITGKPVPGITVQVLSQSNQGVIGSEISDPNGEFIIYLDEPVAEGEAYVSFMDPLGKYLEETWGDASVSIGTVQMTPISSVKQVPVWIWVAGVIAILIIAFFTYKHFKK